MHTDYWTQLNVVSMPLWKLAGTVFARKWMEIFLLSPLLCIPVYGDILITLIVASLFQKQKPSILKLLWEASVAFPSVLFMKLCFWIPGFFIAFIPVYGAFASIRYRTYRAMASSVVVFEGLAGKAGRLRCRELHKNDSTGFGAKVLVLVPLMCLAPLVFTLIVFVNPFEASTALWVHIILILWLITPATALLNAGYYLKNTEGLQSRMIQAPTEKERFVFNSAQQVLGQ